MFKIKRADMQKPFKFKLGDETITFTLNDKLTPKKLDEVYGDLVNAQKIADKETANRQIGICIISLFQLIFGNEIANKIISFFENNYVEMIEQMYPYIVNKITPEIKRRSKTRLRQLKKMA